MLERALDEGDERLEVVGDAEVLEGEVVVTVVLTMDDALFVVVTLLDDDESLPESGVTLGTTGGVTSTIRVTGVDVVVSLGVLMTLLSSVYLVIATVRFMVLLSDAP